MLISLLPFFAVVGNATRDAKLLTNAKKASLVMDDQVGVSRMPKPSEVATKLTASWAAKTLKRLATK